MRRILLVLALIAVSSIMVPTYSVEGASTTPRILYTVRSIPSTAPTMMPGDLTVPLRAVILMAMTARGNSTPISPSLFDGDQLYISPDRTKIATRRLDNYSHDLVVLDEHGTLLSAYSFEGHNQGSAEEWYLWGWRGNDALILARWHNDDKRLAFAEYDLTAKPPTLRTAQVLNDVSEWPIGFFYPFLCFCDVFQFSPSFRYVKTSAVFSDSNPETPFAYELLNYPMIYDLRTKSRTVLGSYSDGPHGSFAWSPTENEVVFDMDTTTGTHLYSYDSTGRLKLFDPLDCVQDENKCGTHDLNWDPLGKMIAFWTYPSSHLVVVDVATHQQRNLLIPASDEKLDDYGILWSPDSSEIALGETGKNHYGWPIGVGIRIIDAQNGNLSRSYPVTEMDALVGYLAS